MYLGVPALLLPNEHEGNAINGRQPTHHGRIVQTSSVAVQLHELVCDIERYVQKGWTIWMPCNLQSLYWRQSCVCVLAQLQATGQGLNKASALALCNSHFEQAQCNKFETTASWTAGNSFASAGATVR